MTHVICDLDGVVYRGDRALDGVPAAMRRLVDQGAHVVFVTNNSTRSPEHVAKKIERTTGVVFPPESVCTSAEAAAGLLHVEDSPALVIGEQGIHEALAKAGVEVTVNADTARSVVVGMWRQIAFDHIAEAAAAIRGGARFVATNTDPTYPVDGALLPGSGAIVAAIATAAGVTPEVAGKPHEAMRTMIRSLGVGPAWVIGDRLDTDIEMARLENDWTSIAVLTGVTTAAEAGVDADYVVEDFSSAVAVVLEGLAPR